MGTFRNIEEAKAFFEKDRFASTNGMVLEELADDHVLCSMVIGENHRNALGGVMGGVIFTLGDICFSILANHLHYPTVAQQVSINYLGAARGEKLLARALCRKDGRSSAVINVDITDELGNDVAQFVGTGFKLRRE